jgi:hypothetical protein
MNMKKRGKGLTIHIHLSNRLSYTLIAIFLLAAIGIGVYALAPGVIPNPGHNISEMSIPSPCTVGQVLSYNGNNWVCATETDPTVPAWAKQGSPPADRFGGMYSVVGSTCSVKNPYTNACSCPSGYSPIDLANVGNAPSTWLYYCYR